MTNYSLAYKYLFFNIEQATLTSYQWTTNESDMTDAIDVIVRKSQMFEKMLTCILIYASRQSLIIEPDNPDASESEIYVFTKFERRQQLHTDARSFDLRHANGNGPTQQSRFKLRLTIARTNLCYDNYSLSDSTLPMR